MRHAFRHFASITLFTLLAATAAAAQALPAPWQSDDIGQVGVAGWATHDAGTFTVNASGTDIWRTADSFHFAYVEVPFDGSIEARVVSVAGAEAWAKAGIMIRQSLSPSSRHDSFFATPGNGVVRQWREASGGISYGHDFSHHGLTEAPFWVRIQRRGSFVTLQLSKDRVNWIGTGGGDWGLGTVYVGLAVTAHDYWGSATGTFDNVTVVVGPQNIPSEVEITQPLDGQVFTAPADVLVSFTASDPDYGIEEASLQVKVGEVWSTYATYRPDRGQTSPFRYTFRGLQPGTYTIKAQVRDNQWGVTDSAPVTFRVTDGSLSGDWSNNDIGAVGAPGRFADGDPIVVEGAGADIWGRADAFHYAYQQVTGNWEIVGRVASIEYVHAWTKAGFMFREHLGAGARHVSLLASANRGLAFQRRLNDGGLSVHTAGPLTYAPVWLRLVRHGSTFAAYFRRQPQQGWQLIATQSLDLPETVYVGMAVSSHATGVLATATFDNVSSAPRPAWVGRDIGAVAAAGTDSDNGVMQEVSASGADIWGAADEFRFLSRSWNGDGALIARVVSLENTHPWAKAGLMFRESLDANARFVAVVATPERGLALQYREAAGALAKNVSFSNAGTPKWLRLIRVGTRFTAAISGDGLTWSTAASVLIAMGTESQAGVAVTSHADGVLTSAAFDALSIER